MRIVLNEWKLFNHACIPKISSIKIRSRSTDHYHLIVSKDGYIKKYVGIRRKYIDGYVCYVRISRNECAYVYIYIYIYIYGYMDKYV